MDDKYFYKLKSVQAELEYLSKISQESPSGLIQTDAKRKICRTLLASILINTTKIQAKMGTDFIPEFEDDEVLPTSYR